MCDTADPSATRRQSTAVTQYFVIQLGSRLLTRHFVIRRVISLLFQKKVCLSKTDRYLYLLLIGKKLILVEFEWHWNEKWDFEHPIRLPFCCCSAIKLCRPPCDPTDCSTSDSSVLHYLPEFAQIHVFWVGDAIQPSHPLPPLLFLPPTFPSIRVFSHEFTSGHYIIL